jgi:hypothetical protein
MLRAAETSHFALFAPRSVRFGVYSAGVLSFKENISCPFRELNNDSPKIQPVSYSVQFPATISYTVTYVFVSGLRAWMWKCD